MKPYLLSLFLILSPSVAIAQMDGGGANVDGLISSEGETDALEAMSPRGSQDSLANPDGLAATEAGNEAFDATLPDPVGESGGMMNEDGIIPAESEPGNFGPAEDEIFDQDEDG